MKEITKVLMCSKNPLEVARRIAAPICKMNLENLIAGCSDCGQNLVKGKIINGSISAPILIINDVHTSDFRVNEYLLEMLRQTGIEQNDVFIINCISCELVRADGNPRLPNKRETENCKHFVRNAIKFMDPEIIISMGPVAFEMFKNKGEYKFLEYINKRTEFLGIETFITHSVKEVYKTKDMMSESEAMKVATTIMECLRDVQNTILKRRETR